MALIAVRKVPQPAESRQACEDGARAVIDAVVRDAAEQETPSPIEGARLGRALRIVAAGYPLVHRWHPHDEFDSLLLRLLDDESIGRELAIRLRGA